MINPYAYYYTYSNSITIYVVAILVAVILSVVLYFTFLSKKNEGKFSGTKEKIYNFLNFNRFYLEEILKLLYLISAAVITVVGIIQLFSGISGLFVIIIGNVALRVCYELIMMFIIICRKTVSVDKKLDKIVEFYGDDFDGGECHEHCEEDGCNDCSEVDCCNIEEGDCGDCCADQCENTGCQEPPDEIKEGINASER